MNAGEQFVRRIDAAQQRHVVSAYVFGVIKKFGDDRGSILGVLIAYYSFVALFPALLAAFTVVGFVLPHYPGAENSVAHSVLREFPVIGPQLETGITSNVHPLHGSIFALVIGLTGLIWGSLGVTQASQHAMNEIWDVPGKDRPGFFPRLLRGLLLFVVFGVSVFVGSAIPALGSYIQSGDISYVTTCVVAALVNIVLFLAIFRVLTAREVATRSLWVGAVVAGIGFEVVQIAGVALLTHNLRHASNVYGTFGIVLGLMSLLYLFAQLLVYSAEANAVLVKRLWPRSIVQPPLTPADRRALVDIALREERRPDQHVEVEFDSESGDRPGTDS